MITVRFTYRTGIRAPVFRHARLAGSWNGWAERPMAAVLADDGCPAFTAAVTFDDALAGQTLQWGVRLDGPAGPNAWAITAEVPDPAAQDRVRAVTLPAAGGVVDATYHLSPARRLGAQKVQVPGAAQPALRFAVWAPHARAVDVVFGLAEGGYIADDGTGLDPRLAPVPLEPGDDGIWTSAPLPDFARHVGRPYMYRVRTAQGATVYRTDIHSRAQIGRGDRNPALDSWDGTSGTLDGAVSCSVVVDQDLVRAELAPSTALPAMVSDAEFWRTEFTPGRPVPTRVDDLVIYELHVSALGFPGTGPGTLADAIALLDHLGDLGVNAVELMPIAECSGDLGWGYGDTHHFVIQSSAGGRDEYRHFVRECHRRGIAVIQDVVYNHFDLNASRAEWQYDSTAPEENAYYWYQGRTTDYAQADGGYLDNGSSGWAPRYSEEAVRQLFIGSALEFLEAFHVDGLRVDLTQAIHRDNVLHADGSSVGVANLMGQKLLREWSRTLRFVRPAALLIAEDHSGWDAVTRMPNVGGLGFDVTWFVDFYHALVGDSDMAAGAARVLHDAGFGDGRPLAIERLADALWRTQLGHVVYQESHDEAGNAAGTLRTSRVAVNDAPLVGATRAYAEARCRVAAALSILSAGTPMFFMGEEIVAQRLYRFDNVGESKEDLLGERAGEGARMFRYFQDLVRLRLTNPAVRSRALDVVHALGATRVVAFTRRLGSNELLVVASLNDTPFRDGYVIATDPTRLPPGAWQETFNSDGAVYGGSDVGNYGLALPSDGGRIELRLPANGVLVLQRR